MEAWIIWLIVAAVLATIEVLTQMIWTLCLAAGCIFAMAASILGVTLEWQLVVLAAASVLAFLTFMPWFKKWHEGRTRREKRDDRTGMDALLGRRAVVIEEIRPGSLGRARIDGDNWQVRSTSSHGIIRKGEEVVVTSYDSIVLDVAAIGK